VVSRVEPQRTPREGFFCLSGDDDKQKDSSEWEEGRKAFFLEESEWEEGRKAFFLEETGSQKIWQLDPDPKLIRPRNSP
jgi:hypothetical protein